MCACDDASHDECVFPTGPMLILDELDLNEGRALLVLSLLLNLLKLTCSDQSDTLLLHQHTSCWPRNYIDYIQYYTVAEVISKHVQCSTLRGGGYG